MTKVRVQFNNNDDVKYNLTSIQNVIIIQSLKDSLKYYQDKNFPVGFIEDIQEILDVLQDFKNYDYSNSTAREVIK